MALDLYGTSDPNLEEAYRYANLAPSEQMALRARLAQRGVEQGVENMARTVLDLPGSEQQQREQAGLELKQLAQKVTPGTAEFYAAAADILRKHNLVAEAEEMTKRGHTLEAGKGETTPALKLQRARDELVKRPDAVTPHIQAAIDAIDRQIKELGVPRAGSTPADAEYVKMVNSYHAAVAAGETDKAADIKKGIEAWLTSHNKSGAISPAEQARLDLGNRREDRAQKKQDDKDAQNEMSAVNAIIGTLRIMDSQYRAAEALLNHPGLKWVTGARAGTKAGGALTQVLREEAADAGAYLETVLAQVFVQALQDLKSASRTSATGLGQLTEREGDKIQNAKVALRPQQSTEQFKQTLSWYMDRLKEGRAAAEGELSKANVPVPAMPPAIPVATVSAPAAPAPTARARAANRTFSSKPVAP